MSQVEKRLLKLNSKQKRRFLIAFPFLVVLAVLWLLPAQPCERVSARFETMQAALEESGFIAMLDTFAYGGHCDTFSLVNDKSFWIVPKCGQSGVQFRDSLQREGRVDAIRNLIKQANIGAVHYHYPTVSFEYNQKFRGGYDFRLVYSRKRLKQQDAFWTNCEEVNASKKSRYHLWISPHWYITARELR
ncbi:MAG: hypothetical protein C0424_05050 [Sphingobacteriaceae bacterium]|nr:hypothetical protein [Sphingobacteriaceae bacterium]